MSLGYYLQQAQAAVDFVKSKMVDGADNSVWDLISSGWDSHSCVPEMRGSYQTEFWKNSPAQERIKVAAMWAERMGCGNCGEQSAIAYQWLLARGVLPLEFMAFEPPKNHNFVVLGRDPASDVAKAGTWGPDAVVCDPWKGKAYVASMLPQVWPAGVPKLVTGVAAPPPPPPKKAFSGR